MMGGAAERANAKMPTQIADGLRAVRITNNCKARIYEINFEAAIGYAAASPEWRAYVQNGVNQAACSGKLSGPLVRHGWRFSHVYNFSNGGRLVVTANCKP